MDNPFLIFILGFMWLAIGVCTLLIGSTDFDVEPDEHEGPITVGTVLYYLAVGPVLLVGKFGNLLGKIIIGFLSLKVYNREK